MATKKSTSAKKGSKGNKKSAKRAGAAKKAVVAAAPSTATQELSIKITPHRTTRSSTRPCSS